MRTFKTIRPYEMDEDEERFGRCFECKDGDHGLCIGVPCECDCDEIAPEHMRCDYYEPWSGEMIGYPPLHCRRRIYHDGEHQLLKRETLA